MAAFEVGNPRASIMCARLAIHTSADELAELFDLEIVPRLSPRYNVAPSQLLPVIGPKSSGSARGLVMMQWGFVPRWANDPQSGPRPINARSEVAAENPAFRDSIRQRRCIIPASGFYEWATLGRKKMPAFFTAQDAKPFAFAGIWDAWTGSDGKPLHTCCILTTTANELLSRWHDRMPVILPREHIGHWLDRTADLQSVLAECQPFPAEKMMVREVSTYVNKSTNEGPECLAASELAS
jgi:putative SOS response-associated peptidase YedK